MVGEGTLGGTAGGVLRPGLRGMMLEGRKGEGEARRSARLRDADMEEGRRGGRGRKGTGGDPGEQERGLTSRSSSVSAKGESGGALAVLKW